MKFFVVFALISASVAAAAEVTMEDYREKLMEKVLDCADEFDVSLEEITGLMEHILPTSHEGKCLIFCVNKIVHLQNEKGEFTLDKASIALKSIKQLPPNTYSKIMTIFKKCQNVDADDDPCESAHNWTDCAFTEARKLKLLK